MRSKIGYLTAGFLIFLFAACFISAPPVSADATHQHEIIYEAADNVITQRCESSECGVIASATIVPPDEDCVYTGRNLMPCTVEFSGEWVGSTPVIYYENNKYVGEALCKITCGDVSASLTFNIVQSELFIRCELQHIGENEELQTELYTIEGIHDVDHISPMELIKNEDGTITPKPTIKDSDGNDVTSNYRFSEEESIGMWHVRSAELKYDENNHWYTCDKCPDEKIHKKNHSFSSWKITTDATYDSPGKRERSCSCGHVQRELITNADLPSPDDGKYLIPVIISVSAALAIGTAVVVAIIIKKRKRRQSISDAE